MGAGLVDDGLDRAEVVLALDGLYGLPVDGGLKGIGVHPGHGVEELRMHGRPVVGVAGLASQHEERLAVDVERILAVGLLYELWYGSRLLR